MVPIIDMPPTPPGPIAGMPMPAKVATSIHACDTGGLTTCAGALVCAPAAETASNTELPSNAGTVNFFCILCLLDWWTPQARDSPKCAIYTRIAACWQSVAPALMTVSKPNIATPNLKLFDGGKR